MPLMSSKLLNCIEVRCVDEEVGLGVFASSNIQKGSTIYCDTPLVSIQHTANRRFVKACQCCHRSIGSVREQFQTIFSEERFENIDLSVLPYSGSSAVYCACGEVYCSPECAARSFSEHHRFLCVSHCGLHSEAISNFKYYCLSIEGCGDNLLLLAQLLGVLSSNPSMLQELLTYTTRPFNEVARPGFGQERDVEWEKWLECTISEAFTLLDKALSPQHVFFANFFANRVKAFQICSRLLSMFELNNIDIAIPSQLAARVRTMAPSPTLDKILREKEVVMRALWSDESRGVYDEPEYEEDDGVSDDLDEESEIESDTETMHDEQHDDNHVTAMLEELRSEIANVPLSELLVESSFPDFHGTGFFCSVARTNHSCVPNVTMDFTRETSTVVCTALDNIPVGVELRMSYISNPGSKSTQVRRNQLIDYLFECQCPLCIKQHHGI